MKTKLLTAGFLLAASISPLTQAAFVGIGWDPRGGNNPTIDLGTLDWAPTSFVSKGGNTAILNFVTHSGPTDFTVYSQARLAATSDPFSNPNTPLGLGTAYEYTMVMGYVENVTAVDAVARRAEFTTDPSKASFFEIYYGAVNSVALNGSGFRDGTLVMQGILGNSAAGEFKITNTSLVYLDGTGDGNQYGIQQTQKGFGTNEDVVWNILAQDYNFFKTPIDTLAVANISQALPFGSVNPSDCFTKNASGAAIGDSVTDTECNNFHVNGNALSPALQPLPPGFGGFVPNVAPKNTTLTGADANPDFIAQTDFNSPLTPKAVPEPSFVLLLGIGLLGMLGFSSKRKMS